MWHLSRSSARSIAFSGTSMPRIAAPSSPGDCAPLEQGYCQRVVDGRLRELIADTARVPAAPLLPETQATPSARI
jgi:hypothetical protein